MISKRATIFNFFLKYLIKPFQAQGKIPPVVMRAVYFVLHYLSLLWPIPRFVELTPVKNNETRGEWIKIKHHQPTKKIIYYLHGGGFFFGSPRTHRNLTWRLAFSTKVDLFCLRYRLAPKHPIPTSVDDSIKGYRWLLSQGYKAEDIIIGGDSAGGNLTLLTVQKIRALNLPMPKAAFCLSPMADMAAEGTSMVENAKSDPLFHHRAMRYIMDFHSQHHDDPRHPEISPVNCEFTNFPPLFLQASSTEILLNDSERIAEKAKQAGVDVEFNIWKEMPHVFPLFAGFIPEGRLGVKEITDFIKLHLFESNSAPSK